MTYTRAVPLIIPGADLQNARDCFALIDPDTGGASTFSVPLRVKGVGGSATHWGASTQLVQASNDAARSMTTTQFLTYVNSLKAGRTVGSASFKNSLLIGPPGGNFWAFVDSHNMERVP